MTNERLPLINTANRQYMEKKVSENLNNNRISTYQTTLDDTLSLLNTLWNQQTTQEWLITNLNKQRHKQDLYYILRFTQDILWILFYTRNNKTTYTFTLSTGQLMMNKEPVDDSYITQFTKHLHAIGDDIKTGQAHVFETTEKGDLT